MLIFCSFVPAESATLGLVDKSRVFFSVSNDDTLMHNQFSLAYKRANRSLRSWIELVA